MRAWEADGCVAFVHVYEEPALRRQSGEQYDAYRCRTPGPVAAPPPLTPGAGLR
jgi:hypothetical protein